VTHGILDAMLTDDLPRIDGLRLRRDLTGTNNFCVTATVSRSFMYISTAGDSIVVVRRGKEKRIRCAADACEQDSCSEPGNLVEPHGTPGSRESKVP